MVKDQAIAMLNKNVLVALADTHSKANARQLACELINDGHVKVFFIEFPASAKSGNQGIAKKYGDTLNAAISKMLEEHLDRDAARDRLDSGGYFTGLNKQDAQPNLLDLAALCIGKGVQVVACDLSPTDTMTKLDEIAPQYKPHSIHSVVEPWGLGVRDKYAASMIGNSLKTAKNVTAGKLMMWGANHLTLDESQATKGKSQEERLKDLETERGAKLLGQLIQDQGIQVQVLVP
ncbi:hypothetical protein KIF53_21780 [Chromobacterium subtsugae]|uniref:UspA domain-containing protein n=1 Tax=Chromobacterium subtsugae TaxID=251747 RepID=A0ABS7FJP3_9NEIS|nr:MULTISPECIES: hypothetical protein [Chromobacterium]MBW7569181.1 hypothetical protein [Chromobacterium subtsugae]MBW8290272.1 hypothetical protein [Chromobacterium subtsugae]WSE92324.1 hypothetical protein U6115_03480 [Chromobacterium subtsugae]WVH60702.1 hypothetical protein U6151_03500 [Chromobacterium subtsugae]